MILAAIFALWGVLFLFPPTIKGPHAVHNLLWIVKPEGPVNAEGSVTEFAHVQEKGEYRLHKLLGMAAGFVVSLVPIEPAGLQALAVWVALVFVDGFTRKLQAIDYAGHGAEILAADRAGFVGYGKAEIERMQRHSDKQGHNVAAGLLRWEWLARIVLILGR